MMLKKMPHFISECTGWRERLRSYRDELHSMQKKLQLSVCKTLSKDEQTELEHLQNQLHIQLINVHDLKQSVKMYDRKLSYEAAGSFINSFFAENLPAYHENLHNNYQLLQNIVTDLQTELTGFMHRYISVSPVVQNSN